MTDCRSADSILLVEGSDDFHVVLKLWLKDHDETPFCIVSKGGLSKLRDSIGLEVRAADRKAVGIVVDADGSPSHRWNDMAERLHEVGIEIPEHPPRDGLCKEGGTRLPRVGIWLMPDNESTGELEDFVRAMLPDDDPVWPLSESYVDGIDDAHRKFKEKKALGAKVHAWLATRELPGRMGTAIEKGDLRIDRELPQRFLNWLRRMFDRPD